VEIRCCLSCSPSARVQGRRLNPQLLIPVASRSWPIIPHDAVEFGHGVAEAPRNAIRPRNLKWELPIAAATGVLIGRVDVPASNHIHNLPFQQTAARWTNIGLGIELGTSGLMYGIGCAGHRSHAARASPRWRRLARQMESRPGGSLGRLAGKKHFPSDVLVGATVGYVTGAYLADHLRE